jgi:hypothetical protein
MVSSGDGVHGATRLGDQHDRGVLRARLSDGKAPRLALNWMQHPTMNCRCLNTDQAQL